MQKLWKNITLAKMIPCKEKQRTWNKKEIRRKEILLNIHFCIKEEKCINKHTIEQKLSCNEKRRRDI